MNKDVYGLIVLLAGLLFLFSEWWMAGVFLSMVGLFIIFNDKAKEKEEKKNA